MNFLLVRRNAIDFCSVDGTCRILQQPEGSDVLSTVEALHPHAVVFLGMLNPDPIESLCQMRVSQTHLTVKAAIIRSEDEVRSPRTAPWCEAKDAFWRFRSLFQKDDGLSKRSGRDFFVDLRARELSVSGRCFTFSPMEFRLLVLLLRYPGVVFSRQELLQRACGNETLVDPQIIDVMVRRIRMKIEANVQTPDLLRTARGLGYKFTDNMDIFFDRITGDRFVSWPSCADVV